MTYQEACAFLYDLERRGVRLGLDRIVGAFQDHGDPQESFGSILVAGTNGKGSVCAFLASCLQEARLRTGLFTSPHLIDFRERMRVDGRMISPEEVVDLTGRIRCSIEKWHLSFFEATTLMAFLWFRDRGVQAAAVEVGLGGRLDATRPVRALATVITTIGLDHTRILGESREAIAGEKVGILREGVPAVTAVSSPGAMVALRRRSRELGLSLYERRRHLRVSEIESTEETSRFRVDRRTADSAPFEALRLETTLRGKHQVANATLATLALSLLPPLIRPDREAIRRGICRTRWPGRCERVSDAPVIVCDVAHNADGARALSGCLASGRSPCYRLVVGMVDGKDHQAFLRLLTPYVARTYFCRPNTDRALAPERLAEIASRVGLRGSIHASPAEALDAATADLRDGDAILVTGSFFTVGEIYQHLGRETDDPLWIDLEQGKEVVR